MTKTRINNLEVNPLKVQLMQMGIAQIDLAFSLQISQSLLSRYLNNWSPMPKSIEDKIHNILNSLNKSYRPKRPIIIKR